MLDGTKPPTDIVPCRCQLAWFPSTKTRSHSLASPMVLINPPTTIRRGKCLKLKLIIKISRSFLELPNLPTTAAATRPHRLHNCYMTILFWPIVKFSPTNHTAVHARKFKRRSLSLKHAIGEDTLIMAVVTLWLHRPLIGYCTVQ